MVIYIYEYVYLEPVCPLMYQVLAYLKSHKLYEDVSIAKGLSIEYMFRFSHTVKIQENNESVTKKIFEV